MKHTKVKKNVNNKVHIREYSGRFSLNFFYLPIFVVCVARFLINTLKRTLPFSAAFVHRFLIVLLPKNKLYARFFQLLNGN